MARLHPKLDNTQKRRKKELTKCPISLRDAVILCALQSDGYYYPQKSFFFCFLREPPSPRTRRMYVSPSLTHTSLKVTNCRRLPAVFSRSPSFYFLAVNVERSYFFGQLLSLKTHDKPFRSSWTCRCLFFFFLVDLVSTRCSELYRHGSINIYTFL